MESDGGHLMPSSGLQVHRDTGAHTDMFTQINILKTLIYQKLNNLSLIKLIMEILKKSKGLNRCIIFQISFRENGSKIKPCDLNSASYM